MIKEMCERHGLTCVYTSKLFYNRFTSSITVNFPSEMREGNEKREVAIRSAHKHAASGEDYFSMVSALRAETLAYSKERVAFIGELYARFEQALGDATEYKMNKASVTFYYDDPSNMVGMIEALKDSIVKITIPRNEDEIAYLRVNADKLIQDKYFLDRFPFRVKFKATPGTYLNEYVNNQFGDFNPETGSTDIDWDRAHFNGSANQPTLYLAHFDDLFLTKIGVQELIETVQEVVLRKA
jgi:hypothetical protein